MRRSVVKTDSVDQQSKLPVVASVHPAWRWVSWFFAITAGLAFGASIVSLGSWTLPQRGLNFLAFVSLAVTSLAVYLAIKIFQNQALQAKADTSAQAHLLQKIGESSSTAAKLAGYAVDHIVTIGHLLSEAQESKLKHPLSAQRQAQALNLYVAAKKELKQVLWVDDRREMIEVERKTFEAAGVAIVWVPNTNRALEILGGNSFGVVITDMARPDSDRAGLLLLEAMRRGGDQTPLIVYSSSRRPDHVAQVLKQGGQGATNDPTELFELIMKEFSL